MKNTTRKSIRPTLLAIAIAQALAVPSVQAASIIVNDTGDTGGGPGCTLREAVRSIVEQGFDSTTGCSNSGSPFGTDDQISFSVATVSLSNGEILIHNNDYGNLDLSINGGSAGVTINGNGGSRLLRLTPDIHLTLDKLTLSGGSTINSGGAIFVSEAFLTLSNSTVSGNFASKDGGGISAYYFGGVGLINSTVSGNTAYGRGGGISTYFGQGVSLSNSTVSENTAYGRGGGIHVDVSTVSLSNSAVSGNLAAYSGGGGISAGGARVRLDNSTVSGNTSFVAGGGIYVSTSSYNPDSNSNVSLNNSTISGNAARSGGGVFTYSSNNVSLNNSIVANSGAGGDCFNNGSSITTNSNSIIEDGSCGTSALSVDPQLGPLADNGGPTKTHALLTGSPAIDAGDNTVCADPPVNNLDQRGGVRPVGSACDIGSYEFGAAIGPGPGTPFSVAPLPDGKGGYFFITL